MALKAGERRFIQRAVTEDAWDDKPALVAAWREFGLEGTDLGDGGIHRLIDKLMARPDASNYRSIRTRESDIRERIRARADADERITIEQMSEQAQCDALALLMEAIEAQQKAIKNGEGHSPMASAQLVKIALAAPRTGGGGIPEDAEARNAERKQKEIERTKELVRQARDGAVPPPAEQPVAPEVERQAARLPVFGVDIPKGRA